MKLAITTLTPLFPVLLWRKSEVGVDLSINLCGVPVSVASDPRSSTTHFRYVRFQLDEKFLEISYGVNTRKKIYCSGWPARN